jgi:glycosyltransferase involved in cell wall biosynthesis
MTHPAVSIVIPVFNRTRLLPECLDSVAAQTLANWECLVVDDGSSDGSSAIAAGYAARDGRFRAVARAGAVKGAAACRNHGLAVSSAPYVMFLDSDDLLHPDCLSARLDFMKRKGAALDFAVFPTLMFARRPGDSDKQWDVDKSTPDLLRYLKLDVVWPINGPLWRSQAVKTISAFDETLPGWQDWQLHVVALLEGLRYAKAVTEADCYVRKHEGEQISKGAGSAAHIVPKTVYLMRLMETYRGNLLADPALREASAGLMWHQSVWLDGVGRKGLALAFWRRSWRLGYIGARVWLEGSAALVLHGRPGGSLAWRALRRWPTALADAVDQSTCHTVSLAETTRS